MLVTKDIAKVVPPAAIRGVCDEIGLLSETDAQRGARATAVLQRLARLPGAVWKLPADWQHNAIALDRALSVRAPLRTASEERKIHAAIEQRLRQAAATVHRLGKMDPYLDVLLNLVTHYGAPRMTTWKMLPVDFSVKQRGPTLSQFLSAMAKMYAREGGVVPGLSEDAHRPDAPSWTVTKQRGANAAAAEAFERVTTLLRAVTGAPHDELSKEMVCAYHPGAKLADFASAARKRRKKTSNAANVKTRRK